jgi:proline iminopeptidase
MRTGAVGWVAGMIAMGGCGGAGDPDVGDSTESLVPHPFSISADADVKIGGMELGGGNRPLIVIHGGPGLDHRYLRPALDALADEHRVIYLDQRGSGLSETPLTPEFINFDALLDDIERVRRWTGFDRVDILGHSWGTVLATHFALRNPESVHRMVLVSPVEPGTKYRQAAMDRRSARVDPDDLARLSEITKSEAFRSGELTAVSRYYELVFKPLLFDPSRPVRIPMDARTARNGFQVMGALAESMPEPDYWEQLSSIGAPTLIVQGAADAYPVGMITEMANRLGDGRKVILEEAGHFPYIEMSAAFLDDVRTFLNTGNGS